MLLKSKEKAGVAATVLAQGSQFESVFKTLMDKIRAFEINHSIYELYLGHLQACYASHVDRLEKRIDDGLRAVRADFQVALDRQPRQRRWRLPRLPWQRKPIAPPDLPGAGDAGGP